MGSWGVGTFENDDAMDFVAQLNGEGLAPVEAALAAVIEESGPPDAGLSSAALAAAEAVAVLRGRPAADTPPEILEWAKIGQRLRLSPTFFDKAKAAVTRVRDGSELRDLWEEAGTLTPWVARVDELISRLS